jgi:hypothetical protein
MPILSRFAHASLVVARNYKQETAETDRMLLHELHCQHRIHTAIR